MRWITTITRRFSIVDHSTVVIKYDNATDTARSDNALYTQLFGLLRHCTGCLENNGFQSPRSGYCTRRFIIHGQLRNIERRPCFNVAIFCFEIQDLYIEICRRKFVNRNLRYCQWARCWHTFTEYLFLRSLLSIYSKIMFLFFCNYKAWKTKWIIFTNRVWATCVDGGCSVNANIFI